jgi:hypothetical protein
VTAVATPEVRTVYVTAPAASRETAPAASTSVATTAIPDVPVTSLPNVASPRSSAPAAAVAPAASAAEPKSRDTDLSAERAIIERARAALARGDGAGALTAVEQHEREFAKGQLVEEREVLAVQALVTAGRVQEAAERGARFRKAFPSSLLLPLVDQVLR